MQIIIETPVQQDFRQVWKGFNQNLFLQLKPPFLPFRLLRFDGSETGDEVHILIFNQRWEALIVEHGETATEIFFIDVGKKLPFPLQTWRHRHRILKTPQGSLIVDDIHFVTISKLTDYLIYPLLYLQFAARKKIYQRVFSI
jgi:ligand-binding SRPBCC domain-containing protein